MQRVILLKTQLVEAARLGCSDKFHEQRLAVILLDNFIEIQLGGLIRLRFIYGYFNNAYTVKQREKIFNHFDELVKVCSKEQIINEKERQLLLFCHGVRNNLYHQIEEEKLLVEIALRILYDVIRRRQPEWKVARSYISIHPAPEDPFSNKKPTLGVDFNSTTEWEEFLDKYFRFIDKRKKTAQKLLSDFIISKIKKTKYNLKFITDNYFSYYPDRRNWSLNNFVLHFSFPIIKNKEISKIKENSSFNRDIINQELDKLFNEYKSNWSYIKENRLKTIEKKALEITKLEISGALEVYNSLKNDINLIYDSIQYLSSQLDGRIQQDIDYVKGK